MARRKRKQLPTEIITVKIEKLSHEAKGICYVDGKTVFVTGALAGETVDIKYVAKYKGIYKAEVVKVINPSVDRVEPPCEFYARCGGCSLQHLAIEKQIQIKQTILVENFKHIAKLEIKDIIKPLHGPSLAYRSKARLGVRYVTKKQKLLVGFREKNSNFLCEMESCLVLHPAIGQSLKDLSALIESLSITIKIPQVEVAFGDDQGALIFRHLEPLTDNDISLLIAFGKQKGFYILTQAAGPDSIEIVYPKQEVANKKMLNSLPLHYYLPEFNIKNAFSATDFTQVNRVINRQMVHHAISLLAPEKTDKILDLFCGMGNFTLALARSSAQVVGVEGSDDLVIRAKQNALANGIENTEFYCADLFKDSGSDDFRQMRWAKHSYDKILIDPARSGAKEIMQYIPQLKAPTIVYVSCNPATLARDAEILVHQHGYQLISAGVMDMFPHTSHVESIALFKQI